MKIRSTIGTFSVAAAVALALAPAAPAYSGCAYVVDSSGKNVTDSSKKCVKTSTWTKSAWTEACGKPKPKPKPKPAPKPAPKPEPVVTPPAPTPPPPPPAPVQPTVEHVTLTGSALFGVNSATLTAKGKAAIDEVVDKLHTFDKVRTITITGHTDSTGSEAYNQKLSERRAQAVADYLKSRGVNPALLNVVGMGELAPIADNSTKEGRQMNRRVEIDIDGSKVK